MKKIIGTVYNVSRIGKTKSVNVGDFDTIDSAKKAMIDHFRATPKRGNFHYTISEDTLEEMDGTILRTHTFYLQKNASFYKHYSKDELNSINC